jgi:hypothetical protein
MKKSTRETAAKQLAKETLVKDEIERLSVSLLPKVENARACYEHAYGTIVKLTIESPDDRLRFDCAKWLRAEYEKRALLTADTVMEPTSKGTPDSTEEVLASLRRLYTKAMIPPAVENPLTLAVDAEGVTPEADARSSEALNEPPEVPRAEESESLEPGSAENEAWADGPEEKPVFRRVPVPGHFPPKFKRALAT